MPVRAAHLHRHPALWSGQFVPAQHAAVEIDLQHTLARGLLGFYMPGVSGKDLSGNGPSLVPGAGQLGGVASGAGRAFGCAALGTPNGLATAVPLPVPTFASGATLWIYRQTLARPVNAPVPWIISLYDQGADNRALCLYSDAGNDDLVLYAANAFVNFFMNSGVANDTQTLAVTFAPSVLYCVYYKGVMQTTGTAAPASIGFTSTTNFAVGTGGNQNIIACGVWTRALSAPEIAWLDREPFAMLRPASRRRVFATPTAAVAPGYRARVVTWS